MAAPESRVGGCQCGNIEYQLHGEPRMLYACHCTDCQKQSASAFGMSLIVDPGQIEFLRGEDQLKYWDTRGEDATLKRCAFCPNCGSRIFHGKEDPDEPISIKAGSLDDTDWLQPIAHIWLRSAQPWISIDPEQFYCFDKEPDDEDKLAQQWQKRISTS